MNTLNQIVEGLKRIADSHQQIHSFGFGDFGEMATSGVINYPIMWAELNRDPGAIRNRRQTIYNFTIYILGIVRRGEGDELEVLSDAHRIAEDVIAEMRHPSWTWNFPFDNVPISNDTEE